MLNFSLGFDISPNDNSYLNYTHILFSWSQFQNVSHDYTLNITNIDLDSSFQISTQNHTILIDTFIDWNYQYRWNVCSESGDCIGPFVFTTNPLPENYPNNNIMYVFNEDQTTPGYNLIDFESLNFSAVIDNEGTPTWFVNTEGFWYNRFTATHLLPSGNIVGLSLGRGYEIDINSNIIFESPSGYSVHHDFNKTQRNTYMAVTAIYVDGYCPDECNNPDWETIQWQGDVFYEFDENGSILWEWSSFDHIDSTEYNPYYVQTYNGFDPMDWTHANSIFYDEPTNSVFVSIRNLSRIIKIDYDSGAIDWELGEHDFMDSIYFDQEFGFSQQHSAKIIDNGNLLFFDNHRYQNPELSRCLELEMFPENDSIAFVWEYVLPDSLFTGSRGECDRLDNGHTLITAGRSGQVLEIDENDEIVWHFSSKMNTTSLPIYRTERIPNLHPLIFDLTFDNFIGNQEEQKIKLNANSEVSIFIANLGWIDDNFLIEYSDTQNNSFEGTIFISAQETTNLAIQLNIFSNDEFEATINIYPEKANESLQSFDIIIDPLILGDMNGDFHINVQDIILMVSIIINEGNYTENGDMNNDGIINILDILLIVNIITQ